jgi:EAL domain-containing protein (putative c-di-GMP-specific phosphodiesterase class I)
VNLSPAQCLNNQLATEFAQIAHSHGVPLSMIDLEVTESAAEDLTSIREQMDGLLAAGTEFALDDFGTGTSNITRLLSLPLHVVKLDMTVVWSYFRGDSTLLPDLINMFRNVNMKVVVEGIETEEMHRAVEEMGCDYEQGYYYSRPLPPQEFVRYMRGLS